MNTLSRSTLLIASLICIDRITKILALVYCFERPCRLTSFCTLDVTFNRGIAFGMFFFNEPMLFGIVTSVIALVIGYLAWYAATRALQGFTITGESLVIAGAFSNLLDRLFYHGVIDFIELSYKNFTWYSFNIADACIVLGVGLMLYQQYKEQS